jgi:transposase
MMRRFGLRDDQWERIKDLLPGREGSVGVTAADNRLFVEAVLYRYRTGMPWRDLPERFGDGIKVHRRFSRWAKRCLGAGVSISCSRRRTMVLSIIAYSLCAEKAGEDQAIEPIFCRGDGRARA